MSSRRKNANKTSRTTVSPADYIATIEHPVRRSDATFLLDWFTDVSHYPALMWGGSIIGYGRYHYRYDSGREGDSLITGFAPRKANLVIYVMPGYRDMSDKLALLGKHRLGKSCLYINKLADIKLDVLADIVTDGIQYMTNHYDTWPS